MHFSMKVPCSRSIGQRAALSRLPPRFSPTTASIFWKGWRLAAIFFEVPRPVKPSQLADAFGTTRGNVSHCVSSLEAKGLLLRKIDPEDARACKAYTEAAGKRSARCARLAHSTRCKESLSRAIGKTSISGDAQEDLQSSKHSAQHSRTPRGGYLMNRPPFGVRGQGNLMAFRASGVFG